MCPIDGLSDVSSIVRLEGTASFGLSSFHQAVEICLTNSLEAGSKEIHVDIDVPGCSLKVGDDGTGMSRNDLSLLGSRNATSKSKHEIVSSGSRGDGIAAICSVAVVEISSRARGCYETHSCLLRDGTLLHLKLAPVQMMRHGTTVSIRNVYFNRPVVQRAMNTTAGSRFQIEGCRSAVQRFALLRPEVTFTLYDRHRRAFIAKYVRGRSQEAAAFEFFGQQHHHGDKVDAVVHPLMAVRPPWTISGWTVRPPLGNPNPSRQFISLNGYLVEAPEVSAVIEELYAEVYRTNIKLEKQSRELLAVRKASNLHPMFILNLEISDISAVEMIREAEKRVFRAVEWPPLAEAVKSAFVSAWRPVVGTHLLDDSGRILPEPSNAAAFRQSSKYRGMSDIFGVVCSGRSNRKIPKGRNYPAHSAEGVAPVSNERPFSSRNDFAAWPKRRRRNSIGTGSQRPSSTENDKIAADSTFSSKNSKQAPPSALDDILSAWKNPALMPSVASGTSEAVPSLQALEAAVFASLRPHALQREELQNSKALRQIDLKFIPIVCRSGVLALVDQHAADERVRLERLRAEVLREDGWPREGMGPCMALPYPQLLRLTADEAPLLEAYSSAAASWGWRWIPGVPPPGSRARQVSNDVQVTHVPLISHRALTTTDLRLYLHRMAETGGAAGPPEAVIRVMNSRACRSAIMFGDELAPSEAQQLANDLQKTNLCFICAHGRPTTVPLVDLKALRKAAAVQTARVSRPGGRPAFPLSELKRRLLSSLEMK